MRKLDLTAVNEFLALRRIAMAGVSRNAKDFSGALFRELAGRGYDLVPVHPAASEIEGRKCYAAVSAITPPPEGVLIMTGHDQTAGVVRDAAAAGVKHVWMYKAAGPGAVDPEAVEFCRASGIRVVAGECPFMFLPRAQWFHRLHGYFRTWFAG